MKIPNGERADLGTKLEDYVLNELHDLGKHKARVFKSVLGITLENRSTLATALLHAAASSSDAVYKGNNGFGDLYQLSVPIRTDRSERIVLSAWIIKSGEDFPQLVTCFIL